MKGQQSDKIFISSILKTEMDDDLELHSSSDNGCDMLSVQEQCSVKQLKKPTFKQQVQVATKPNVFEEQLKMLQQQQQNLQNINFTSATEQPQFKQQFKQPAVTSQPQFSTSTQSVQNQDLMQRLAALEEENRNLMDELSAKQPAASNPEISKKFVELNAKNRQLTSAIEVQKSKNTAQQQIITAQKVELDRLHAQVDKLDGKPAKQDRSIDEKVKTDDNEIRKKQENELLQKYGEQNVKLSVLTTENNKLRLFLKKETGMDWEELQKSDNWKGKNQKIVDMQLKIQQLNELNSELMVQIQGGKSKLEIVNESKDEKLFRQQVQQIQMLDMAVNELKQKTMEQGDIIDKQNDKLSKSNARIAGLEQVTGTQKQNIQKLILKSKLDDELINDFRVYVKSNKIQDRAYIDELEAVKIENRTMNTKMQNALNLLNTKQDVSNLELVLAGCQLELAEKQESVEKLQAELKAVYARLIEVADRRLKISSEAQQIDLSNIVKEMQTYYRYLQSISNELQRSQQSVINQFQEVILGQGLQGIDLTEANQLTDQMEQAQNSEQLYDQLAKQQLDLKPRKRVAKAITVGEPAAPLSNLVVEVEKKDRAPSASYQKYQADLAKRTPKVMNSKEETNYQIVDENEDYADDAPADPLLPDE